MDSPCFELDDWLTEYIEWNPCWRARLSDGSIAIQDDGRPRQKEVAWKRLKRYVLDNGLKVCGIHISYRGVSVYPVPDNCSAYYFINSCKVSLGESPVHYLKLGYSLSVSSKVFHIVKVKIPELFCEQADDVFICECSKELIISNAAKK